ncbi:MAG: hypothetical protein ACLP8S_27000 [Solirubrobacteraceae bacterium]
MARFSSPVKLTGYTGLCPPVSQSGERGSGGTGSAQSPSLVVNGSGVSGSAIRKCMSSSDVARSRARVPSASCLPTLA